MSEEKPAPERVAVTVLCAFHAGPMEPGCLSCRRAYATWELAPDAPPRGEPVMYHIPTPAAPAEPVGEVEEYEVLLRKEHAVAVENDNRLIPLPTAGATAILATIDSLRARLAAAERERDEATNALKQVVAPVEVGGGAIGYLTAHAEAMRKALEQVRDCRAEHACSMHSRTDKNCAAAARLALAALKDTCPHHAREAALRKALDAIVNEWCDDHDRDIRRAAEAMVNIARAALKDAPARKEEG